MTAIDGPAEPPHASRGDACRRRLASLLPAPAVGYVDRLLDRDDIVVRLAQPRRTKLGDHRPPGRNADVHRISVNVDLNPYALLTTLVHEVAHAHAWELRRRRPRRPHGPEWQAAFGVLLRPLVTDDVLPPDVRAALEQSLTCPRAATCSDRRLLLALSRYDRPDVGRVFAETVAVGALFRIDDGTIFRAGPMLRTRRRCFECRTGQEYRVHGLARVEPLDPQAGGGDAGVSGSSCRGAGPRSAAMPRRRR